MTSMLFVIPRSGLKRKRSGRIFLRVHSFDWPYLEEEYIEYAFKWPVISRGSLHDLITWSTFGKHEYSSLLKNFASTSWKSISKLGNLIIFSPYLKSSDCNCRWKLEAFVWEKQLLPSGHTCMVFHTNPCNFEIFKTVMKYFHKH